MDSFWQLPFFLVLFFTGLTITTATSQSLQSCNDLSLLTCNHHSSSSSSSSNSKFQLPQSPSSQIDPITTQVSNDDNENLDKSDISIIKAHGILSGIGWGILMPIGAMMARYLKAFEGCRSSWFNFHRTCQILSYVTGTTSVVLGIYIGIMSEQFSVHGYIGFAIFFASTFQMVVALNYRPKEEDRERIFWNISHYLIGYGVIALAIFNMFKGFSISSPYHHHHHHNGKKAYFGIIVSLGCVALMLEVTTWFLVCKKRKEEEKEEGAGNSEDNI